jgi:hypothetical protein
VRLEGSPETRPGETTERYEGQVERNPGREESARVPPLCEREPKGSQEHRQNEREVPEDVGGGLREEGEGLVRDGDVALEQAAAVHVEHRTERAVRVGNERPEATSRGAKSELVVAARPELAWPADPRRGG